ncbi:hypothetical protein H5410_035294, partial [Solanum commersonii]
SLIFAGKYHPSPSISKSLADWCLASLVGNCTLPSGAKKQIFQQGKCFVDEEGISKACGCPLLPLKSHIRGPAPVSEQDTTDIVDEAITFFRANVFFKNFDIKSSSDKLLIYLTLYINIALKRLEGCRTLAEGTKAIINLGLENVPVPGEAGFPFPGLFSVAQSQKEAEDAFAAIELFGRSKLLLPHYMCYKRIIEL